jgi:AcrR family transcriptional regulator
VWTDDRNAAAMNKAIVATRPAHRPSRRTHIVESAMKLFARVSFDDVTVGDIADAADMTPAAVYYHFAGKEQILLEGMQAFSSELLNLARRALDDALPVADLMTLLLEHIRQRKTSASVFFINSAGLNLALEAHRKTVRADLADLFADAAQADRGKLTAAEAGVMGAALVSLLEVSAVATLGRDRAVKGLGVRGLPTVVADLVKRIVGP